MFYIQKLNCSQDVADAINKGQDDSNKYRINVLNLEPQRIIAVCFPENHIETINFKKLTIADISMYYNLQNILVEDKIKNSSNLK